MLLLKPSWAVLHKKICDRKTDLWFTGSGLGLFFLIFLSFSLLSELHLTSLFSQDRLSHVLGDLLLDNNMLQEKCLVNFTETFKCQSPLTL